MTETKIEGRTSGKGEKKIYTARKVRKRRTLRRAHKSIKVMWKVMQYRYKRGMDARLAVRVPFPERVHDSLAESFKGDEL